MGSEMCIRDRMSSDGEETVMTKVEAKNKIRLANWMLGGLGTAITGLLYFNFTTSIHMIEAMTANQTQGKALTEAIDDLTMALKEEVLNIEGNSKALISHEARIVHLEDWKEETNEHLEKYTAKVMRLEGKIDK